ncbi:Hypp4922 [Branchiostoma lanceolatum]|uniref:Hypp4922 protein n=1 Tax=Branchiostoma lanceolatum TaxID=7740 RepID=A0A8K0AD54_BRALA|nr:Hypp4922 [Branchiostoma lanceolatum]
MIMVSLSPLQPYSRPSQLLVCTGYRGCEPRLLELLVCTGYRGCEPRLLELLVCTGYRGCEPRLLEVRLGYYKLKPLNPPSQLLVCTGYRGCEPRLLEVLQELRQTMCGLQGDRDVLEVVPMQQLLGDGRFQHFLKAANEAVLHRSLATVVRWEKQLLQTCNMQGD